MYFLFSFFPAVCHPVTSARWRLPFSAKVVSVVAWTASALIMLPVILYANTINYSIDRSSAKVSCIIMWPQEVDIRSPTIFTLYSFCLGFATPLTLILGFYYLVIQRLRYLGPKSKQNSKECRRPHRKVTKLVLTIITIYVLCWTPYWISQLALINSPPDICKTKLEITIFVLVGCLGYSNSAMNPILYAFLSENFKKSFLKACLCSSPHETTVQLKADNSFLSRFGRNRGPGKNWSSLKKLSSKAGKFLTNTEPGAPVIEASLASDPNSFQLVPIKPPVLHTDL